MTNEKLKDFKSNNTRSVPMPDGSTREVRMTPELWDDLKFLRVVEGISPEEIAGHALEEVELNNVSFDRAFRGVVAHLANRWTH